MIAPDGAAGDAPEQLGEGELAELAPEGDAFEDLDLNDCNDWEFVP